LYPSKPLRSLSSLQKPHPPVIVGGAFPYSARRAIRYGEGWIPQAARGGYSEIADMIPRFREMATEAGRDPTSIEITVWFPKRDADLMKRYQDLGVSRVVFNLESERAETVLPAIDAIATLMREVNG
jgi:alkanesulfonate monooxygenase SsuD/methylene tetrahydromethanopterin reductase-like flavin-dependent oxidoreductase (luciferase family)